MVEASEYFGLGSSFKIGRGLAFGIGGENKGHHLALLPSPDELEGNYMTKTNSIYDVKGKLLCYYFP
jgi:hypothetical protein